MAAVEIVQLSYRALRAAIDGGSLPCVDVVDAYLARVERYAGLHAYAHVDARGARGTARQLDDELARGEHRGPLHGIPCSVKDGYPVAGLPCTFGSRALYDIVPRETCEIVAKAQAAGAVLLGINTMAEAGMGDPVREGPGANGRNPRNDAFVPGGSSTGTATATAAGLTVLGIGGDGGGSVRNPAASCGVVGMKPSDGRMPGGGSVPWAWSMGTSGFFGRDVATIEAALTTIVGTAPAAAPAAAPRLLALPEDSHGELSEATRTAYRAAIELLGAEVGPALDLAVGDAWLHRLKELAPVHALHLLARGELYSDSIKGLVAALNAVTREQYLASFAVEERLAADLVAAMAGYDALLTPANPWPGLRWHEWPGPRVFDWYRFAWPFNLVRFPGVTLPTSFGEDGMPLAVQLVGRSGEDERLIGVAAWAESLIELDRSPVSPTWA